MLRRSRARGRVQERQCGGPQAWLRPNASPWGWGGGEGGIQSGRVLDVIVEPKPLDVDQNDTAALVSVTQIHAPLQNARRCSNTRGKR